MNKEKESEKLYYYGKDNYQKIKQTAEKKVIEWRWSKGSLRACLKIKKINYLIKLRPHRFLKPVRSIYFITS